jgi:hypothetical protein
MMFEFYGIADYWDDFYWATPRFANAQRRAIALGGSADL